MSAKTHWLHIRITFIDGRGSGIMPIQRLPKVLWYLWKKGRLKRFAVVEMSVLEERSQSAIFKRGQWIWWRIL